MAKIYWHTWAQKQYRYVDACKLSAFLKTWLFILRYCNDARQYAALTELLLLLPIQLSCHVVLEEFHSDVSTERSTFICRGQAVFTALFNTWRAFQVITTLHLLRSPGSPIQNQSYLGRCQWARGIRRRSVAARLVRMRFRVPSAVWMAVCCVSSRGLCDGPISHSEESYQLCAWHRVWPGGTMTLYSYREFVDGGRL